MLLPHDPMVVLVWGPAFALGGTVLIAKRKMFSGTIVIGLSIIGGWPSWLLAVIGVCIAIACPIDDDDYDYD